MPEYIDREALIAEINEEIEHRTPMYTDEQNDYIEKGLRIARKDIKRFSATDVVKVVHGEWKFNKDGSGTCNQCGIIQKNVWNYDSWQNYCGHCGADMRGIKKRSADV